MFGSLGGVTFQVINGPQKLSSTRGYKYEQQPVIEGKPAVQFIHDELEKLSLEFLFHQQFTNPTTAEAALEALSEAHQAVALVFGNGQHEGDFVITELKRTDIWRADDGTAIAISMSAELLEWSGTLPAGAPSAIPTNSPALIGNGEPQTALYAGVNQVPAQNFPQAPTGLDANDVTSDEPMYPTYPLLPYVPAVGQIAQSGSFTQIGLSVATRWGF